MPNVNRRTLLRTISGAGIAASAGCIGTGLLQSGSGLQDQLDSAREATEQYSDPQKALRDGYKIGGPYVPGMGWHFSHPERLQTAVQEGLDVEKPPMLTYVEGEDGLTLGSIEYALPANAIDGESPDLFDDEQADATEEWHTHEAATHVFAKPDGERTSPESITFSDWVTNDYWAEFQPPDENLEAGDEVALNWGSAQGNEGETDPRIADLVTQHPDLETLHAWVTVDNPDGVFAPTHPEYAGDGHDHDH